jgi:hypothetical protein
VPDRHADYERHRKSAAARQDRISTAARDIAPIPAVVNPARKAIALHSLRRFYEIYFPATFCDPWSPDHLRVIDALAWAVTHGMPKAIAMPRGSGKTAMLEKGVLWAAMQGLHMVIGLIAATATRACELLESIRTQLDENDLLFDDFPEVCHPVRMLRSSALRATGQTYRGVSTGLKWSAEKVVLPRIPGSPCSGVAICAVGLEGSNIRGMKHERKQPGRSPQTVRPSLVIIDDPQTPESARSQLQCEQRESLLMSDVLGMAGPGKPLAALVACTVIHKGDVADRILDRSIHPEWRGERCKMLYSFPENLKLWDEYNDIRVAALAADGDLGAATAFYGVHRADMDLAARVGWPARKRPEELSALQHAMNLYYRNRQSFASEYQNEPEDAQEAAEMCPADAIAKKINRLPRFVPAAGAEIATGFIDVQGKCLYYLILASAMDGTPSVIDYGTWPDQQRKYFTLDDVRHTLRRKYPSTGEEGAIYAGLEALSDALFARSYLRDGDRSPLALRRLLIDANWGKTVNTIYQFCRSSAHRGRVLPSHGRFYGATARGIMDQTTQKGDLVGDHWKVPKLGRGKPTRAVVIDVNHWKSQVHLAWSLAAGDRGSLSAWGDDPTAHRMMAEQCCAETPMRATAADGRSVDEWRLRPDKPDNHLFDCLVGALAAASVEGVRRIGKPPALATKGRGQKKSPEASSAGQGDTPEARVKRRRTRRRVTYCE